MLNVRIRQISCDITYIWKVKKRKIVQINLFTKWKQIHRLTGLKTNHQRGKVCVWGGINQEFEINMCILCACMLSHFSHVELCDPMDCSLTGSSVHRIL